MIAYFFKRISCTLLSILLAASIVCLTVSLLFVGFFGNEQFVQDRIDQNKTEIIADINDEVKKLAKTTGLPKTAFVNAVNEDNFSVVSFTVAKNLKYCYRTDFSENVDLYNVYYNAVSDTSRNGGKKLHSNEASRYASLAVTTACKALNQSGTANVRLFNALSKNFFVFSVISSVVVLIASVVALELVNKGRHRKYSYIGMGIITAGYVLVAATMFVEKMGYIEKNVFLVYDPYNKAIQTGVLDVIHYDIYIGAVFLAAGFIMLLLNYNYFRKKNIKAVKEREFNKKLATDFLEYDEPTVSHRLSDGEGFEKEVTKINFEDE